MKPSTVPVAKPFTPTNLAGAYIPFLRAEGAVSLAV